MSNFQTFMVNLLVSGTAAALSKTLLAPVERIKMILQNQDSSLQIIKQQRQKYESAFDIVARVPKEQGWHSFWRGNGVNIMRYIPMQALNFSFNDFYLSMIRGNLEVESQEAKVKFIAGGLAGMSSLVIVYPLDFCQTKIIADIGTDGKKAKVQREYKNLRDCLRCVYREEGITGYYRGLGIGLVGILIYRSLYFGLYDFLKRNVAKAGEDVRLGLLPSLLIAQTSSIVSGTISYPVDTVLRRIIIDSGRPEGLKLYKNTRDCAVKIYRQGGVKGFYKGVLSNIVRSTAGALVLVFYDGFLYYTNWKEKLRK